MSKDMMLRLYIFLNFHIPVVLGKIPFYPFEILLYDTELYNMCSELC